MSGVINVNLNDVRDYQFDKIVGFQKTEFPKRWSLPDTCTGTQKDQGSRESCVAETFSSIMEAFWNSALGVKEEHSEGFIYGAYRGENSKSPGMIMDTALKYACALGSLPKKYFDKCCEMPEMKKVVDQFPDLYLIACNYRASGYVKINYADAYKRDLAIKNALQIYNRGLIARFDNHCVQIVGWDDDNDSYIYKNSYGAKWGENGRGYKKKKDFSNISLLLFEPIAIPFEDIKPSDWYYKDVVNMYFSGIVNGKSDTSFKPNDFVTRAEVAAMLNRFGKKLYEQNLINEKVEEVYNKII